MGFGTFGVQIITLCPTRKCRVQYDAAATGKCGQSLFHQLFVSPIGHSLGIDHLPQLRRGPLRQRYAGKGFANSIRRKDRPVQLAPELFRDRALAGADASHDDQDQGCEPLTAYRNARRK